MSTVSDFWTGTWELTATQTAKTTIADAPFAFNRLTTFTAAENPDDFDTNPDTTTFFSNTSPQSPQPGGGISAVGLNGTMTLARTTLGPYNSLASAVLNQTSGATFGAVFVVTSTTNDPGTRTYAIVGKKLSPTPNLMVDFGDGQVTVAVSALNSGRLRYNNGTATLQFSASTGAFSDVLTGTNELFVPPGTNRSALINAAIVTQAALYAIDGVRRRVRLGAGTYTLTAATPLALLSGVELVGAGRGVTVIDTSLVVGTPDDPLNYGIGAVGTIDAVTLNSTLSSVIAKGGSTVNFTAVGTLVPGQYVLIDGRNVTSNSYPDSDGLLVRLYEVLPVTNIVGLAVTFGQRAWQYHAAGVRVRRITPIQHVGLRHLSLHGGATSAVGALFRSCLDVTVEDVGGYNYSRTIVDLDQGTVLSQTQIHDEGACNSSLYVDSAFATTTQLTTDPAGARFNPLGVQRGCLHTRNRATGLIMHDSMLIGRCSGINLWGLRHAMFSNIQIRDMDGTQALATGAAANEIFGGLWGCGVNGNTTNIGDLGEYINDTHWVNIDLHDLIAGGASACWWLSDDVRDSTHENIGFYNDSGAVVSGGWIHSDAFNCTFKNIRFRAIQFCIWFINQSPGVGCTYEDINDVANAADAAGSTTTVLFFFQSAGQAPAGNVPGGLGARFRRCQITNAAPGYFFSNFPVPQVFLDYSIAFYDCIYDLGGLVSYAVPALNASGIALSVGDLVQLDAASPAGVLQVIGSGGAPNTRNAVVVIGGPYAPGGAGTMVAVAPLPQHEAFVNCDVAAVNVGDLLVASATAQQATAAGAPAAYTACGRARQLKAAGAAGIVPITT